MPTEIIIPRRHRHRRHSSVGYRTSSAYRHGMPAQTYVTGPATGMQYAANVPVASTPYIAPTTMTTPYVAQATPMMTTAPLVAQPQAINYAPTVQTQTVQPTAISAIATPMVTTNALPRPISAPPIAGSVYGDPNGMGGVGYTGGVAYGDPYSYGGTGTYNGHGARPGYDVGYGYGGGGGGMYDGRYPGPEGGYGYPGAGSAYEYYGDPHDGVRAPFNQRVAGSLEQLGGYLVDSPDMVARGYARRVSALSLSRSVLRISLTALNLLDWIPCSSLNCTGCSEERCGRLWGCTLRTWRRADIPIAVIIFYPKLPSVFFDYDIRTS
ncbi:hypothetical protein BC629DRAFT_1473742 [Irpex lacteus]|nr:hypothetical protein BC629DRAFT_1473742 [Irpex lacteus]